MYKYNSTKDHVHKSISQDNLIEEKIHFPKQY